MILACSDHVSLDPPLLCFFLGIGSFNCARGDCSASSHVTVLALSGKKLFQAHCLRFGCPPGIRTPIC